MEWTLSVLKEALRKYSVVPVVTRNLNAVRMRPPRQPHSRRSGRRGRPAPGGPLPWLSALARCCPAAAPPSALHSAITPPSIIPQQDDELAGHRIPRGAWIIVHLQVCVCVCEWVVQRNSAAAARRSGAVCAWCVCSRRAPAARAHGPHPGLACPCRPPLLPLNRPCAPCFNARPAGDPPPVPGAAGLPAAALHARRRVRAAARRPAALLRAPPACPARLCSLLSALCPACLLAPRGAALPAQPRVPAQ